MLTELGPQRKESTVIQYSTKHEPYEALLYGLRMAISLGVRRLMAYIDSDLVVNQVMKEWVKEICPRGNNKVIIYFLI